MNDRDFLEFLIDNTPRYAWMNIVKKAGHISAPEIVKAIALDMFLQHEHGMNVDRIRNILIKLNETGEI